MMFVPSLETIQRDAEYVRKEKQERLRDTFAAAALTGLLANAANGCAPSRTLSIAAYHQADAMLRQRERTNHDAVPEAIAQSCEESLPQAASELGNPVRHLTQDGTGNTQEPVAWYVASDGYDYATLLREHAEAIASEEGGTVSPLYHTPQPTLTDAEREAIEFFVEIHNEGYGLFATHTDTLRKLLERLK